MNTLETAYYELHKFCQTILDEAVAAKNVVTASPRKTLLAPAHMVPLCDRSLSYHIHYR